MTINLLQVKNILDSHLGTGSSHKNGEISYYCPFCNHYKKKLQVNVITQKFHCWVCSNRGLFIASLLKKSNASIESIKKVRQVYGDMQPSNSQKQKGDNFVTLPEEYKPLYKKQTTPEYKNALHYAMVDRGLTAVDILRYRIGYCESGPYSGMLIIPSYDEDNNINFFVGRSYYKDAVVKHKNPPILKDVIGFENQINWNEPITIVEGVFDAIAVKRNAIPLFGKQILDKLKAKILYHTKQINLCLDSDAIANSYSYVEYFTNHGIDVRIVHLPDKDPSTLGYNSMIDCVNKAEKVDFIKLISYKLNGLAK
jgi:DNA primase